MQPVGCFKMYCDKSLFYLTLILKLSSDLAICNSTRSDEEDDDSIEDGHSATTESVSDADSAETDQLATTHAVASTTTNDKVDVTKSTDDRESDFATMCPHFKNISKISIESMADVWQTAYYQLPHKVPCFKMLIRKVTGEEKHRYSRQYGDFNEKVAWDDCNLEIKASGGRSTRKHFLQGCEKCYGILENIIFEQKDNDTGLSLHEESPDQWLVVKNLLLMRDCENGQIVVFSRVPHQPKLDEVVGAMGRFGKAAEGEWACAEAGDKADRRQAFDADFESDSDVVFFE